jgi:hypothetical protein
MFRLSEWLSIVTNENGKDWLIKYIKCKLQVLRPVLFKIPNRMIKMYKWICKALTKFPMWVMNYMSNKNKDILIQLNMSANLGSRFYYTVQV